MSFFQKSHGEPAVGTVFALALAVVGCGSGTLGHPGTDAASIDCSAGVDSDGDGVANDLECSLGTDPNAFDTDGDGASDRDELAYPTGCIATDSQAQRRPPPPCANDGECLGGERCLGLNPLVADTDGDGLADGLEDDGCDGVLDSSVGETDPRLPDTNGDGVSDGVALEICTPDGLAAVSQVRLGTDAIQVGHDPAFGTAVTLTGTGGSAILLDDPSAAVAGTVFGRATTGDLGTERLQVEQTLAAAVSGLSPVLVGRQIETHEGQPGVMSTYLVAQSSSASALRDATVAALVGASPPAGAVVGAGSEFSLHVTIVVRSTGAAAGWTDVIVAVAPLADCADLARTTSIRINDLVNATAVAEVDRRLGPGCGVFTCEGKSMADFVWAVDTSGSMTDDQTRLGNTATRFFENLTAANVDFRVGVINAGNTGLNLDSPGFAFIDGLDATGADQLCQQVTVDACPATVSDGLSPYPFSGSETPAAASVVVHHDMVARAAAGETNPDRRFRDGATPVAFFVTDEPGSNDFSKYFATSVDPETGVAWGSGYGASSLAAIVDYFARNQILTFGLVPVRPVACSTLDVYDLPRCVIEGNGGASIPIETATQTEIDAAMEQIVTAVAGATSQFSLLRIPITSTLRVVVAGETIPRSRLDGFDYDAASRSIIFFGRTYRPEEGEQVVISYRTWEDPSTVN